MCRPLRRAQTYLEQNGGPGLQHLALKSDNIFATLREMRARSNQGGFDFMPRASPDYYRCAERWSGLAGRQAGSAMSALHLIMITISWATSLASSLASSLVMQCHNTLCDVGPRSSWYKTLLGSCRRAFKQGVMMSVTWRASLF